MNQQTIVTIGIAAFGLLSNFIWLLINLRVQSRIRDIVDELKDWMSDKYADKALADERHKEVVRRLDALDDPVKPRVILPQQLHAA